MQGGQPPVVPERGIAKHGHSEGVLLPALVPDRYVEQMLCTRRVLCAEVLQPHRPPGGLGAARPARPPRTLTDHQPERSREPAADISRAVRSEERSQRTAAMYECAGSVASQRCNRACATTAEEAKAFVLRTRSRRNERSAPRVGVTRARRRTG